MLPLSGIKKEQNQPKQVNIDLNCDIGQSFGVYKNDNENELLPFVSSVNISCGAHAGDPLTIMNALKTAKDHNLVLGAHIGFPDIQGFGYRSMQINDEELQSIVLYQIGALTSMAKAYNVTIEHVRPHGALYKQASLDFNVSLSIAKAIHKFDPWLIYIGAAGETLNKVSLESKIRVGHEIHLDKVYNLDGSIDYNSKDIEDLNYSVSQLESLINDSTLKNNQNGKTKINVNTIHLNMKSKTSLSVAQKAKELILTPTPIAVNYVSSTGWV